MEQELYFQKLSEVCEWSWEKVKGESGSSGRQGDPEETPEALVIKSFHPIPCQYVEGQFNCQQKIFWKEAKTNVKRFGVTVRVTQCQTCGGLISPKGRYIPKPDNYNYALLCWQKDQEE